MPTAAPWADVACRASPDGRPHRPQSKSGHRSRRSGKPTGSVCRSSPLPSCVLQMAPLSPAQAATTTRSRPQLRPQDWIRSQTPGSPPVRRSQTSAAATLRPVEQCRSSMVGSPGHQLADPDHQQWSPHNAQICAAGAERGIDAATAPNGGSVRVLHGLRGHSACCRPPSSIDVDWAWLRCGRKTEALDCAVLHCPTWVSATRAQTRLSHQSAQSRRKAGHWCPAGQDRVPSGRYEPRRSRGAIWRRSPATGSSRRAAAPRAAAWPRRPRRISDRGYPQRSIRTSSPVSSSRHSCHWSS